MRRRKRNIKSGKSSIEDLKSREIIELSCSTGCGNIVKVDTTVVSVICGTCICKAAGPTSNMIKRAEGEKHPNRPKGIHLMNEYVDPEGNVFHKGIEMPELKGTKTPTVIVPKIKLSKAERRAKREERKLKREERMLKRRDRIQKREERKLKREEKLAKKYNKIEKDKVLQEKTNEFFNGEDDGTIKV